MAQGPENPQSWQDSERPREICVCVCIHTHTHIHIYMSYDIVRRCVQCRTTPYDIYTYIYIYIYICLFSWGGGGLGN